MGGVGHAIGKVISAPFRAVGKLFGARTSVASVTQSAGAAAAPAADAQNIMKRQQSLFMRGCLLIVLHI